MTKSFSFPFLANRQLDMAGSMEILAFKLKQLALHSWNIVVVETACGKLLHFVEDLFGIPEKNASHCEGDKLEAAVPYASDMETKRIKGHYCA